MGAMLVRLFVLPVFAMTDKFPERERLAGGYTNWLSCLEKLDLMDVHKLKPIVDGNRLKKELGKPPGNWLKDALDIVVRWQLRNPDQNDPEGAIREVAERYN